MLDLLSYVLKEKELKGEKKGKRYTREPLSLEVMPAQDRK